MRQVIRFVMLAGAAMLVGCATEAPAPAPATIPAHPVTASATAPTQKIKIPEGYNKVTVNGEDRYCRDEVDTGSRLARTKVCLTAEQLQATQDSSQALMYQFQNRMGIGAAPTGGSQGVGGR